MQRETDTPETKQPRLSTADNQSRNPGSRVLVVLSQGYVFHWFQNIIRIFFLTKDTCFDHSVY